MISATLSGYFTVRIVSKIVLFLNDVIKVDRFTETELDLCKTKSMKSSLIFLIKNEKLHITDYTASLFFSSYCFINPIIIIEEKLYQQNVCLRPSI